MEKSRRTYKGAGTQTAQAYSELRRSGDFGPDHLVTVKFVSEWLSVRLQMVKQIPVARRMIDKRGYYRKGDIEVWMAEDLAKPDSLLRELREQHAKSKERIAAQPSRRYVRGQPRNKGGQQAKAGSVGISWLKPQE